MKHRFVDLSGKRWLVTTCDACTCVDIHKGIIQRGTGRDLCDSCWDYERGIDAEGALFPCIVCGNRRTNSFCGTCILRHGDI